MLNIISKKKTLFFNVENPALPTENIIAILPLLKGEKTDSCVSIEVPGASLASRAEQALEEAVKQHFSTGYSKADRVKLNILLPLLFHFPFQGR